MKEGQELEFHNSYKEFELWEQEDLFVGNGKAPIKSITDSHSPCLPVIGITTYGRNAHNEFSSQTAYTDAVRLAGGIPVLLPPGELYAEHLLPSLDGLILAGGGDIEPDIYKGKAHPMVYSVDRERDTFELKLSQLALAHKLPILGICRGLQVLNVASGGDLVVHVPDVFGTDIFHRLEEPRRPTKHTVQVVPLSRLAKAMGTTTIHVASWHHQSVQAVPPGWQIVAYAPDGVIEAIEHEQHPWAIAVQWHPEMSAVDDPSQAALFRALVKAAVTHKLSSKVA